MSTAHAGAGDVRAARGVYEAAAMGVDQSGEAIDAPEGHVVAPVDREALQGGI